MTDEPTRAIIAEDEPAENLGEAEAVQERKSKSKLKQRDRDDFLKAVMNTPEGRSWIWDMLSICGVYQNPFTPDAAATAFRCGEMNIGQQLLADVVRAAPDLYITMQKEASNA